MPLTVTVNTIAECLRTDCNILGDNKRKTECAYNYYCCYCISTCVLLYMCPIHDPGTDFVPKSQYVPLLIIVIVVIIVVSSSTNNPCLSGTSSALFVASKTISETPFQPSHATIFEG